MSTIDANEALAILRDLGHPRSIEQGQVLAMEGDDADGFWWLLSGIVRIHQISSDGRLVELGRFRDDSIVAAALAFAEAPFPHHIEALSNSDLLWFPHDSAWQRIISSPQLSCFFLRMLADKCRFLNQRLRSQGLKTLRERLLDCLILQSKSQIGSWIAMNQSKKDLALELGTTPETLSRALRSLCDDGYLEMRSRNFRLVNLPN